MANIIENQILINTPRGIKADFYRESSDVLVVRNCRVIGVADKNEDGIQMLGPGLAHIEQCYLSNEGFSPDGMDELASVVDGADVIFEHCYFGFNGKGVLIGSGDTIASDYKSLRATFNNCVFDGCCRRSVYAQFGQTRMHRCWVRNWGIPQTFHEKANGARSGKHGQLMVSNSIFEQRPFWSCINKNFFRDLFHQYNHWWYPGFMKAVYAEFGGQTKAYHCYKNRWWLRLANHTDPMKSDEAEELKQYLTENVIDCWKK